MVRALFLSKLQNPDGRDDFFFLLNICYALFCVPYMSKIQFLDMLPIFSNFFDLKYYLLHLFNFFSIW